MSFLHRNGGDYQGEAERRHRTGQLWEGAVGERATFSVLGGSRLKADGFRLTVYLGPLKKRCVVSDHET